jgi:hypothetical protein
VVEFVVSWNGYGGVLVDLRSQLRSDMGCFVTKKMLKRLITTVSTVIEQW